MRKVVTKVFMSGRSQAVRIPKEFRFKCEEVYIENEGERIVLSPKRKSWDMYFDQEKPFSDDFPDEIEDVFPEDRESF